MAISLIVGRPGDGKSYSAVHLCILPALQMGRSVFTNIPVNVDLLREELQLLPDLYLKVVDKEQLDKTELYDIPGGTLIVLDEVWRYWKKEERKPPSDADEKFFAEHRHRIGRVPGVDGALSQDIVLITQGTTEVPGWIKSRIASTYKVVKLNAVGSENRFRVDFYRGAQGERPQKDSFISCSFGRYSADVWRYYQSHTLGDQSGGIATASLEAGPSKNVAIWSHPRMLLNYALAGIAIAFIVWRFGFAERQFLGGSGKTDREVKTKPVASIAVADLPSPNTLPSHAVPGPPVASPVSPPGPPPGPSPGPLPGPPPGPSISPDWWVTARVDYPGHHEIVITDGSRSRRIHSVSELCRIDGEVLCEHGGLAYGDFATRNKSVLPSYMRDLSPAGAAQDRELASNPGAALAKR